MYIKRVMEKTIKKMVNEFPVIVISGARQVGKSTMLQMIKEDNMNYVTLDDLDARNLALSDPKYFLEQHSYPLLIDEIQYAPNLLPYIKMIVDDEKFKALKNNTEVKSLFWLTESQQFKVIKDVSESLAGRVGVLNLYSLSNSEIKGYEGLLFTPKLDELKKKEKKYIAIQEKYSKEFTMVECLVLLLGQLKEIIIFHHISTHILKEMLNNY